MTVIPSSHQTVNLSMNASDLGKFNLQKLLEMSSTDASFSELDQAICHLQSLKKRRVEGEYETLKENIKEDATKRLCEATMQTCEPVESPLHPRKCLKLIESMKGVDVEFMKALLNSAVIKECEFPTFKQYTIQPDSDANNPESNEFMFIIVFSFGFTMDEMKTAVSTGLRSLVVPDGVCGIIADYVGDSFFEIKLTVYFDKSKTEWSEQDGEAWIFHRDSKTGKLEDVVIFDGEMRIYYVEDWPLKGLVVDSLDTTDKKHLEEAERRLITWTCCQIVWFALNKHISEDVCHSALVRKMTKKIIAVLKGWFTGLLLGESFEPPVEYFNE